MSDIIHSQIPILTFVLEDKKYALRIDHVVEVAAMMHYSPVADSISALIGLVNRHGDVMPLIDLRVVFGLNAPPIDTHVLFIVAQFEGVLVGLVVDTVNQVEYIQQGDLRDVPGGGRWVQQVAGYQDDLIQIISISAIITHLLPESLTTE